MKDVEDWVYGKRERKQEKKENSLKKKEKKERKIELTKETLDSRRVGVAR